MSSRTCTRLHVILQLFSRAFSTSASSVTAASIKIKFHSSEVFSTRLFLIDLLIVQFTV